MGLETGTYINSLVATNPVGTDAKSAGDDHIRLLKSTIKATFPNITGAVTPTQTELNFVDGVTSAIQPQLDNKQPLDATLTALAALATGADKLAYSTGADTFAETPLTAFARTLLDDADAATARGTLGVSALTPLDAYPVGAVYISVVSTSPATLFGGTWAAFGAGRVLVGIDAGQPEFDTVEETGGAKTHTLSAAEMPSHTHSVQVIGDSSITGGGYPDGAFQASTKPAYTTGSAGGGGAHNNLQPYIVCYFWKRTA